MNGFQCTKTGSGQQEQGLEMQQISGICIIFNVNLFVYFDIVYSYKEGFFLSGISADIFISS